MPNSSQSLERAPTIYIVDDEEHLGSSLVNLFESMQRKAVTFKSAADFLANVDARDRGCILLDVQMPGMTGLEMQERLAEIGSQLPIIFMTGNGNVSVSVTAMKAGAFDFLLKPFSSNAVIQATDKAIEYDEKNRVKGAFRQKIQDCSDKLTPRETEVLKYVSQGLMNKQIAHEMSISEIMVKLHRGRMMRKMQATSIVDIVRKYDFLSASGVGVST
ncbi:response regulator [Rhizobium sp. Root1204]|uniref:response regulator transcription factor n=1 Tax=Rhizobium sp. Root1204 TaxID=1736428 RepID=UPI000713310F|nr:response regulator [Rhizobium sp. Root1204]KQV36385.1 two-component system response regulator [Rhizobium sp. Root1204]